MLWNFLWFQHNPYVLLIFQSRVTFNHIKKLKISFWERAYTKISLTQNAKKIGNKSAMKGKRVLDREQI